MRLFSLTRERSVDDLFGDMAQTVSTSAEIMSRTLGESPSERPRLATALHACATDAAALNRRIANRLATSLITPFEADALHMLSLAMTATVDAIERTVDLVVRLRVGTIPNPLMEVLVLVERLAELTVQASWELGHAGALTDFYEEVHRIENHAQSHLRSALATCLEGSTDVFVALREREVIAGLDQVMARFDQVAQAIDLLRVKDS
ncbi:MAG: DUF47 family protein [Dermabacter sp.]|nr:DUF47 family protein [Dermabacter sp.]